MEKILGLEEIYHDKSDFAKAESYYLEQIAIREKTLGREHPDFGQAFNELGKLYRDMGDYAKAESYLLEAKAVRENFLAKSTQIMPHC